MTLCIVVNTIKKRGAIIRLFYVTPMSIPPIKIVIVIVAAVRTSDQIQKCF
jgi:hypothetical protein